MANGRGSRRKAGAGRDGGSFLILPCAVTDSRAYFKLSHPARSLLIEFLRQFVRDNNGRLLASAAYLQPRGWNSVDVITRAKRELLEAGFIHETVKGHRPNRASWYALTFLALDMLDGYDDGAAETFQRGAYRKDEPLKNASLRPSGGIERRAIAPSGGVERPPVAPSGGAMKANIEPVSTPSGGDHLEMPSVGESVSAFRTAEPAAVPETPKRSTAGKVGRPRKVKSDIEPAGDLDLPPRLYARPRVDGKTTYRYHPLVGKRVNLGQDRAAAVAKVRALMAATSGKGGH